MRPDRGVFIGCGSVPTVDDALTGLLDPKLPVSDAEQSPHLASPGLYAVHAVAVIWQQLHLGEPPDGRVIETGPVAAELELDRAEEVAYLDQRLHAVSGPRRVRTSRVLFPKLKPPERGLRILQDHVVVHTWGLNLEAPMRLG